MLFCFTCRRFVPRDAAFCPGCGGSIGGTRCKNGHVHPGLQSASFCPTCRSKSFVPAATTLNMGCLSRIVGWGVAILCLKWGFANIGLILGRVWDLFVWIVGCTFLGWLITALQIAIAIKFVVWGISLGSKETANAVDPFPGLVRVLVKGTGKLLTWIFEMTLLAVEGRRPSPGKKRRKKDPD